MKIIHQVHPQDFSNYPTQKIREQFLLAGLVVKGEVNCTYTHYDRMVIGAAVPDQKGLTLETYEPLKSPFFLSRREIGIVNIGGEGSILVDDEAFILQKLDCLYIGKGERRVQFISAGQDHLAKFIFFSAPAHAPYPVQMLRHSEAAHTELGSLDNNNHRTINKYIHADGLKSCQLVMGLTTFEQGSIWNTMPPHLHDRRMEAYFYFDLPENQRVVHFMGEPQETRHLFLNNEEGVISPPWSVHSGTATAGYSFIWAMAGENMVFTDMDAVDIGSLQ